MSSIRDRAAPGLAQAPGVASPSALRQSGLIVKFTAVVVGDVASGRVMRYFGETLRQAGILIISTTMVVWGLIFISGLECGIEGAYLLRAQGAPQYSGVFSAWCDLREIVPLAFGYMMSAKVGTGIVAELGSMRISSWMVLPFVYIGGVAFGFLASFIAVIQQVGGVSTGGYALIFWEFQNPGDLLFSLLKAMAMATMIVLVGCYYGYTASGGPVGVGVATAKSMIVNIVGVHIIAMLGTQLFWGANPRAPIGG